MSFKKVRHQETGSKRWDVWVSVQYITCPWARVKGTVLVHKPGPQETAHEGRQGPRGLSPCHWPEAAALQSVVGSGVFTATNTDRHKVGLHMVRCDSV